MRWRVLSNSSPRALYVERFWTDEEAEIVLKFARPRLARSTVVSGSSGSDTNSIRTSDGMFITDPDQTNHPVLKAARLRASLLSGLAPENIEGTQVLHYIEGHRYLAHPDYFYEDTSAGSHISRGGQRVASMISWLSDCAHGGNTSFPNAQPHRISVPPRKGDAVLFYDCSAEVKDNGFCSPDHTSMHSGDPPEDGADKWVAVFWIRQRAFH